MDAVMVLLPNTPIGVLTSLALGLLTVVIIVGMLLIDRSRRLNHPPLKDKKPHQTFAKWAKIYGRIDSIRTGASTMVVLNSAEVAEEIQLSTQKLSNALTLLTSNKSMVATSDHCEFHKMVKCYILTSVLGSNAQKRYRGLRDTMINNIVSILHSEIKDNPQSAITLRKPFEAELFRLALKNKLSAVLT